MSCDSVTKALSLFLYGELSFEEEEAVHQHLDGCGDCRQALARERALHNALDEVAVNPPADLLAECRGDLRRNLDRESVRRRNWLVRAWDWTGQPVSPSFLKPAGAVALLMLGFFAGRLLQPAPGTSPAQTVYAEDAATRRLLFDAAGAVNDPSLRLDSVAILGARTGSPEVSRMLVRTVRSDPNPVVRLKAIDGLKSYGGQAEVRQALSEVLLNDDNLGVRTHAVDLLRQHQDLALAGVLQQVMGKESNDYVRMQCQKMLEELNASLETF
jgi:HEAT repeat protein